MKPVFELGIVNYPDTKTFTSEQYFAIDTTLSYIGSIGCNWGYIEDGNNQEWNYNIYGEGDNSICSGILFGDNKNTIVDAYCLRMGIKELQSFENSMECYDVKSIVPYFNGHNFDGRYFIRMYWSSI